MKTILFVCVHNSGRSQIAESILNQIAAKRNVPIRAKSAGTCPSKTLNPKVVKSLREIGINTGGMKPKHLTPRLLADSEKVISMGCDIDYEQCPTLDMTNVTDWDIPDPSDMDLDKIREVRETIKEMVVRLLYESTC